MRQPDRRGAAYINATVTEEGQVYRARALSVFSTKEDAEKWLQRQVVYDPNQEFRYRAVEEAYCPHSRQWYEVED
tara:strand:- start:1039 stop:1263 length:225 start_codon:yes stop_codon:yes gene_type:complete